MRGWITGRNATCGPELGADDSFELVESALEIVVDDLVAKLRRERPLLAGRRKTFLDLARALGAAGAETASSSSGTPSRSAFASVLLPSPDVPVMTKTGTRDSAVEEANELRPLPVRQAADRLGLADAALVQEARGLHAPELRHRHQHVEHFRRRDVFGRIVEDFLDLDLPQLQVLLELSPPDADVVGPSKRLHALIERTNRRRR